MPLYLFSVSNAKNKSENHAIANIYIDDGRQTCAIAPQPRSQCCVLAPARAARSLRGVVQRRHHGGQTTVQHGAGHGPGLLLYERCAYCCM